MNKGFTLIEVLVSSALFFIIVSAGLVAFSTFLKFYELAHKKRISLYSISFAVEEIIREARIGHNYKEEDSGSGWISIESPQKQARIHFRKNTKSVNTNTVGYIESCKELGSVNCKIDDDWIPITDARLINIKNFLVDSVSSNNGEIIQPRLSIFVLGEYNTRGGQKEEVSLQTQVVQRVLDVNDTSTFKIETGNKEFSNKIAFIYADNGLCYDDSLSSGFADRCYSDDILENGVTTDIESPCEKIILHPTKVVGTTEGVYILTDNGRVYFSSDSDLVNANGIVTVFNKFHRVKSYPEERNLAVPIGVGPWGIVDIFANPHSKFAYFLDRDGHLFVAGAPEAGDPEKAYGGVAKEILIDKTTSYKIKNFAINKDSSPNNHFYIVFDHVSDKIVTRVRVLDIIDNNSNNIDNVVSKITDAIEHVDCEGGQCLIDFTPDAGEGKFYRISDIKISSEIAVAEINQSLTKNNIPISSNNNIVFFVDEIFDENKYTQYEVLDDSNFIARDNNGKWNLYDSAISSPTLSPINSDISDGKSFVYTGDNNIFDISVDSTNTNGAQVCKYPISLEIKPNCPTISNNLISDSVRYITQYNNDSVFVITDNSILIQTSASTNT